MYVHLGVALISWLIGLAVPLPDAYMTTAMLGGFIAFLLFLKELLHQVNNSIILQAEDAEQKNHAQLSSFKGKFVRVRDDYSPISEEFVSLVFFDGQIEVPLFCRNAKVIQKAAQMPKEMVVFYENYILVDVKDIDQR